MSVDLKLLLLLIHIVIPVTLYDFVDLSLSSFFLCLFSFEKATTHELMRIRLLASMSLPLGRVNLCIVFFLPSV